MSIIKTRNIKDVSNGALHILFSKFKTEDNGLTTAVFPHSNENLSKMFKKIDVKDKAVATVGSSSDQLIYSVSYGAKEVTLIDANPLAYLHAELKLAAIKNLEFDEFCAYFTDEFIFKNKYYEKIKHDISGDSREIWELILKHKSWQSKFTRETAYSSCYRNTLDLYNNPEIFYNAKKNLENCNIQFILSDIEFFHSKLLGKKYDFILLSNILDYVDQKYFFNKCVELSTLLNDNGKMQIHYDFERAFKKGYSIIDEFAKYMDNKALAKENKKKRRLIDTDYKTEGFEVVNLDYSYKNCKEILYEQPMTIFVTKDFLQGKTDKSYESFYDRFKMKINQMKENILGKISTKDDEVTKE